MRSGWALAAIVVIGTLISTAVLAVMVRGEPGVFPLVLIALLCIVGTQAVLWMFTAPANRATNNWTMLPESCVQLRKRWEYSHAASAILNSQQ